MSVINQEEIVLTEKNPIDCLLRYCDNVRLGFHPLDNKRRNKRFETNGEIFYRGEPKDFKDKKLTPKIFRKENLEFEESDLILDFEATFCKYYKNFKYNMDWLSLMQHNGLPTRLLDWTINPLVALYFSLSNPEYEKEDGIFYLVPIYKFRNYYPSEQNIYYEPNAIKSFYFHLARTSSTLELDIPIKRYFFPAIDEKLLTLKINTYGVIENIIKKIDKEEIDITDEFFDEEKIIKRDIIKIETTQSHRRIIAQSGRFTLHYGKYINGYKILTNEITIENSIFFKNLYSIRIPHTIKNNLLRNLMLMNINEFSLFPEEDNYFSYLKKKKQMEKKEIKIIKECETVV